MTQFCCFQISNKITRSTFFLLTTVCFKVVHVCALNIEYLIVYYCTNLILMTLDRDLKSNDFKQCSYKYQLDHSYELNILKVKSICKVILFLFTGHLRKYLCSNKMVAKVNWSIKFNINHFHTSLIILIILIVSLQKNLI